MPDVPEHAIVRHLTEVVITPEHADRTESAEFRRNKERLRADGHDSCWVCGTKDGLKLHHYGCEWSLLGVCDPAALKAFCEEWDPYGYGRLLRSEPIGSADDMRNLLWLCQEHHTGVDHHDGNSSTGIHSLTLPVWVLQRLAKKGEDPVPQAGETEAHTGANVAGGAA